MLDAGGRDPELVCSGTAGLGTGFTAGTVLDWLFADEESATAVGVGAGLEAGFGASAPDSLPACGCSAGMTGASGAIKLSFMLVSPA